MRKIPFKFNAILFLCGIFFLLIFTGCDKITNSGIDYNQEMRDLIVNISKYAKNKNPDFVIIPKNGLELGTNTGDANGITYLNFITSLNATACEGIFYGFNSDDEKTPGSTSSNFINLCSLYHDLGVVVFSVDYCSSQQKIDSSYLANNQFGFISFAASNRNLNSIPSYPSKPFNENSNSIKSIHSVNNFLYLINGENYKSKTDFINTISQTNYDMLVIDLFHSQVEFSKEEITLLKKKPNGNNRLVICYLNIGEAADNRYYWDKSWTTSPPLWLKYENSQKKGNYKVEYWNSDWKKILLGSSNAYLDKILSAQFDGVWLDGVDAFSYFNKSSIIE